MTYERSQQRATAQRQTDVDHAGRRGARRGGHRSLLFLVVVIIIIHANGGS
jgi:hypothetical protein